MNPLQWPLKQLVPLIFKPSVHSKLAIPKHTEILEIQQWISGREMSHLESFKASFMKDIFEYIAAINPNTPFLSERLKISYQLSDILRSKASRLNEYADSLPITNSSYPIYWKNTEFTSCLPLRQLIAEEFLLYRNSYDKIFDLNKKVLSNLPFEEFIYINSLVNDRSVVIKNHIELIPVFDSFPHSFDSNTEAIKESNVIKIVSTKDIPENTILTRNFGHLDNYMFLMKHGLIVENNQYHSLGINLENLEEWGQIVEKLGINNTQTLNRRGNPDSFSMHSLKKSLFRSLTKEGLVGCHFGSTAPTKELEKIFRIVFLNESDMDEMGLVSYTEIFSKDFNKPLTERNERNVRVLAYKCADMTQEILNLGFIGKHPQGKRIEDIDKTIVSTHLNYYRSLIE